MVKKVISRNLGLLIVLSVIFVVGIILGLLFYENNFLNMGRQDEINVSCNVNGISKENAIAVVKFQDNEREEDDSIRKIIISIPGMEIDDSLKNKEDIYCIELYTGGEKVCVYINMHIEYRIVKGVIYTSVLCEASTKDYYGIDENAKVYEQVKIPMKKNSFLTEIRFAP